MMTIVYALPLAILIAVFATIIVICAYTLAEELEAAAKRRIWRDREIKRLQHISDTAEDDTDRIMALAMLWNCRYERGDKI